MSDTYGRKPVVIFADILFTAGAAIMALAPTIPILMIGRVVTGLGVGIASLVVPMYLSEISPIEVRGVVVAFDVMLITSGQFISSIISLVLGRNWRLMLGLAAVPSTL
jgi:MFS transporter, SP family, solute carrier family 2 (myo-inositol transporter), member 13